MKKKFTLFAYMLITIIAMSCSATRTASAQSDYPPYDNSEDYNNNNNYQDDGYDNNDNYEEAHANTPGEVNINVFYDQLNPYGKWVDYPAYGRVWICNESGFSPYYTKGHWAYTSYGWTWVSDYRWGWAPFHYGRWAFDAAFGWMWVPGYEWGPAWVTWRTGGDYYGWAPIGPGINVSFGLSFGNYIPANHWYFTPRKYITYPYINRYCVDRSRNVTIIKNTTIINNTNVYRNTRYITGPSRTEVERYTGRRINALNINNASRPGSTRISNNNIQLYRPDIRKPIPDNRVVQNNVNNEAQQRELQNQNQPIRRQPPYNNINRLPKPNDNISNSQQLQNNNKNRNYKKNDNGNNQLQIPKPGIAQNTPNETPRNKRPDNFYNPGNGGRKTPELNKPQPDRQYDRRNPQQYQYQRRNTQPIPQHQQPQGKQNNGKELKRSPA